jgi:hypothetical protein
MPAFPNEAVEARRRKRFLAQVNSAYALRADSEAWETIQEERLQGDATLGDGLVDADPKRDRL